MPTDPSTAAQLGGIAVLVLLVAAITPAVLAFERYLARQVAKLTRHEVAYYRRTRAGNLRAIAHPSRRTA